MPTTTQQPKPLNAAQVAALLTDGDSGECVTVAYYPGEESAVASISPWFCAADSARLLFLGDNCADCGDDLTADDSAQDHVCEGDGPVSIWLYLDPSRLEAAGLDVEAVASWLDCGDPYESAGRVAAVLAIKGA